MITITVIAAVIGTTELILEALNNKERHQNDRNHRKTHLYDLLMEPLKGCKGLNIYRHDLMQRVMSMPDLEVRERLEHLRRLDQTNY